MAMLWTPLSVMQGIYIKYYGFALGVMAAILLLSRVYDALMDVAVGVLSDWVKRKTGRRKPLLCIGAILFCVTALFVYAPQQGVGPLYLGLWLLGFFTGYATLMISHLAWGAELAQESQQKTAIFSLYRAAGYVGLCVFYALPLLPAFKTPEISPESIRISAYVSAAILVFSISLCLKFVPESPNSETSMLKDAPTVASGTREVFTNRPFLVLMGAYVLCGTGLGIWYGMIFLFVDVYLRKGALFAPIYLAAFAVGAVSSIGWNSISARIGKKAAWAAGMCVAFSSVLLTFWLSPQTADPWALTLVLTANTIGLVSFELLPGSILADVTDYSLLRDRHSRVATYFSIYMFATKALFALGGALGLGLAGFLGFDPHLQVQSEHGVLALRIVMAWLPGVLIIASLGVIYLIPMDERRHAVVRRRLDQRNERSVVRA